MASAIAAILYPVGTMVFIHWVGWVRRRERAVQQAAAAHRPGRAALKGPHWYLNAIAARQGERARGVGAQLLEPYIDRSNRERIGIYLESSNPRNLSFYRRYGFVEFGPRIDLPEAGPPLQPMWRAPT